MEQMIDLESIGGIGASTVLSVSLFVLISRIAPSWIQNMMHHRNDEREHLQKINSALLLAVVANSENREVTALIAQVLAGDMDISDALRRQLKSAEK